MSGEATLLLVWRFTQKGHPPRTILHDFVADGAMSTLCREVAACIDIVDNGRALYEGVIGDLEGEVLRLRNDKRDLEKQLEFWIARPIGALA